MKQSFNLQCARWEDYGVAHSQYIASDGRILGDVKEAWRCWEARVDGVLGQYTNKPSAQRAVEVALNAAPQDSGSRAEAGNRRETADRQHPASVAPAPAVAAPAFSGDLNVKSLADQLDACKLIVVSYGLSSEFTGKAAVPTDLLNKVAAALRTASERAEPTGNEDETMVRAHLREFDRGANFTPVEIRLMKEIIRLRKGWQ